MQLLAIFLYNYIYELYKLISLHGFMNKTNVEYSTNLSDFYKQIKRLSARTSKAFGGRYFVDKKGNCYSLNRLIQIYQNLRALSSDHNQTKSQLQSHLKVSQQTLTYLNVLDSKGTKVLQQDLSNKSASAKTIAKLFTHMKQFVGNLTYNRKSELSDIQKDISKREEEMEIFDDIILPENCNLAEEMKKFPGILFRNGNQWVIRTANEKMLEKQKEGIQYDDRLESLPGIHYLQHETTMARLKDILKSGQLLPRNMSGVGGEFGNGDGDGDYFYTQAMTHFRSRYPIDMKKREILYDKNLPDKESKERVLLILDPKLLQERDDYYAAQSWNYGPFTGASAYRGPEVRKDPKYRRIRKDKVIPSVNQVFKKIGKNHFLPNEVGFKKPIDLNQHLVKIILPRKDQEISSLCQEKGLAFSSEIKKTNELFLHFLKKKFRND